MEQRRSQRLIALGGVLRRNPREDSSTAKISTERISSNATQPRKRGLWQELDTVEEVNPHRNRVNVEIERPVPPSSPFFSQQRHPFEDGAQILPPTVHENTENTPPPKRRQYIPPRPEEEARHESGEALPPQSQTTWFTPIRPSRPHPPMNREVRSTPANSDMPSRMPSFAQWIDGAEISGEGEKVAVAVKCNDGFASPPATAQQRRGGPLPRGSGCGGVDMSDLAVLYDPQIAAVVGRSPPTPVEKILYRRI